MRVNVPALRLLSDEDINFALSIALTADDSGHIGNSDAAGAWCLGVAVEWRLPARIKSRDPGTC